MSSMRKVVAGSPKASMDVDGDRKRPFRSRQAEIAELVWIWAVGDALIGWGWRKGEDGIINHVCILLTIERLTQREKQNCPN